MSQEMDQPPELPQPKAILDFAEFRDHIGEYEQEILTTYGKFPERTQDFFELKQRLEEASLTPGQEMLAQRFVVMAGSNFARLKFKSHTASEDYAYSVYRFVCLRLRFAEILARDGQEAILGVTPAETTRVIRALNPMVTR